jgi:hypothetical protein
MGIRERFFIRKVILFIHQFNSGLKSDDIRQFVTNVIGNKKFREKVNEKILILLDNFNDEFKSLILAELLKSWIRRDIDWAKFQRLTYSVERSHPSVFTYLYDFHKANFRPPDAAKFVQQGVFTSNEISLIVGSGLGTTVTQGLAIWKDGLDLCEYGLKGLFENQYQKFPSEFDEFLKNNRVLVLNDPFFTDYEREILHYRIDNGFCYELRKDFARKIGEYISKHN